ncbi:PREDICTED: uncharacterized protein LOC104506374, partial [Eurypyga helias]|uniref:uncharacterized protein LOC104506374 n=1 Tax=Eurypyga helias TaxID=54383 RepID=UPI000528227A
MEERPARLPPDPLPNGFGATTQSAFARIPPSSRGVAFGGHRESGAGFLLSLAAFSTLIFGMDGGGLGSLWHRNLRSLWTAVAVQGAAGTPRAEEEGPFRDEAEGDPHLSPRIKPGIHRNETGFTLFSSPRRFADGFCPRWAPAVSPALDSSKPVGTKAASREPSGLRNPLELGIQDTCTNGHLMCAGCFIHLLADARLKEEQATCPNCRCEISKSLCCRNLAVEKAVSELPSECGFCMQQFPRSLLERHQKEECQDRVTQCKYKRIGCPWQGPYHELTVHEAECTHPTKTGNELMEILDEMDQTRKKEMQLYNSIFSLLSFEKIGYT